MGKGNFIACGPLSVRGCYHPRKHAETPMLLNCAAYQDGKKLGDIRKKDISDYMRRPRVEDWRADGRLRWVVHGFLSGPQSGCHSHVSSPRHIERSVRVSRTTLTCLLRAKVYGTYHARDAFVAHPTTDSIAATQLWSVIAPSTTPPLPAEIQACTECLNGSAFSLAYIPWLRSCKPPDAFIIASLPPVSSEKLQCSRAPSLCGRYPASSLLRAHPPPSRLRPTSRVHRL